MPLAEDTSPCGDGLWTQCFDSTFPYWKENEKKETNEAGILPEGIFLSTRKKTREREKKIKNGLPLRATKHD